MLGTVTENISSARNCSYRTTTETEEGITCCFQKKAFLVLLGLAAFFYLLSWRFCQRSERSKLGVAPDDGVTQEHKNENKENVIPVRFTSIPEETFVQNNCGISNKDIKDDGTDLK